MYLTLEEQLFWMELEHRKKKARELDISKVNLNAEGEELRQVLANMQGKETISNREFKSILYCMDKLNWTLGEIIQARGLAGHKSINILQIVSCSKDILLEDKRVENRCFNKGKIFNNTSLDFKKKEIDLLIKNENRLSCSNN